MAPSKLMTTTEVGQRLGITRQQVRWRIVRGHLKGHRIGTDWFVREAEVQRHLPIKRRRPVISHG